MPNDAHMRSRGIGVLAAPPGGESADLEGPDGAHYTKKAMPADKPA